MNKELLKYMNETKEYYTKGEKLKTQEIVSLFLSEKTNNKTNNLTEKVDNNVLDSKNFNFDMGELKRWRDKNNGCFEIRSHNPITSHRKYIGKILIVCKKVVRKCLKWYINPIVEQQNEFNGSVTASINAIYNNDLVTNQFIDNANSQISDLKKMIEINEVKTPDLKKMIELNEKNTYDLRQKLDDVILINQRLEEQIKRYDQLIVEQKNQYDVLLDSVTQKFESEKEALRLENIECKKKIEVIDKRLQEEVEKINSDLENKEEILHYLSYKLNKIKEKGIKVRLEKNDVDIEVKETGYREKLDYFMFENKFRGSRKAIKETQRQYLQYFIGKQNVLDIGSGRGEFLELLQENNISNQGIEIYDEFVEYCQDKGLNVEHIDAINYFNKVEDHSLGGVFMGQVVEHLTQDYLLQLIRMAYDKLENGAYFIAETPNPKNLTTFTNSFYLDPSHINPVHPDTFKFLLESVGFKEVKLIYTENSKPNYRLPLIQSNAIENVEEVNSGLNCISELIFGSLDYAIVARK